MLFVSSLVIIVDCVEDIKAKGVVDLVKTFINNH